MPHSSAPFAQWLNATMQRRGLSQAEVAREVGVADVQISRWRRGQVTPSVRYLRQIATTFDVPRATLEKMAGYPAEDDEAGTLSIDPEAEAELQAYQARYRRIIEEKVPPRLRRAYLEACEALADELSASYEHALDWSTGKKPERQIGFHKGERHEPDPSR